MSGLVAKVTATTNTMIPNSNKSKQDSKKSKAKPLTWIEKGHAVYLENLL